jgi:uncharacterized phage protein (TIGR02220 family)
MRINIKSTQDILNDDLSLVERGILITILLLRVKGEKEKILLAKVKSEVSIKDYRKELIALHDKRYIIWSEYDSNKKLLEKSINPKIAILMQFMSNLYRRKFQVVPSRITLLNALLKQYSEEEIKSVIANRYAEWKDDEVMKKHLVPETIFRMSKFIKYLEEVKSTRVGESLLKASEIDLQQGDEITYKIALSFIDSEVYRVKSYDLDNYNKRIGLGSVESRYGKDIKRLLKIQKNSGEKNFVLIYMEK